MASNIREEKSMKRLISGKKMATSQVITMVTLFSLPYLVDYNDRGIWEYGRARLVCRFVFIVYYSRTLGWLLAILHCWVVSLQWSWPSNGCS
jgi:hypothetical protein